MKCEHKNTQIWEPHLAGARKCKDCGLVYNNNAGRWYCEHPEEKIFKSKWPLTIFHKSEIVYKCECGAKLKATGFSEIRTK